MRRFLPLRVCRTRCCSLQLPRRQLLSNSFQVPSRTFLRYKRRSHRLRPRFLSLRGFRPACSYRQRGLSSNGSVWASCEFSSSGFFVGSADTAAPSCNVTLWVLTHVPPAILYPFEFSGPTSFTSLAGFTSESTSPIAGKAFVERQSSKAAIPLGDLL